jgi:hypothetical protein
LVAYSEDGMYLRNPDYLLSIYTLSYTSRSRKSGKKNAFYRSTQYYEDKVGNKVKIITYFPLIGHGPHRKQIGNNSFFIACVFVVAVTFLPAVV